MKLSLLSVLSLILLFHAHFSLGRKSGSSSGKSSTSDKSPSSSPGRTQTNSNTGNRNNQGPVSEGGHKQHGSSSQGDNTPGGGHAYGRGYGSYGHGGYEGGYGGHRGYGSHGGYGHGVYKQRGAYRHRDGGDDGSYRGGYINRNPSNAVLSPYYGNYLGYGGRGDRGGSPFYHRVKAMGKSPSAKSKGFGHTAAKAASGVVVAKMAVDHGLGRFPSPHFQFQSPEEEYYYNHYMYRTYGVKSTDAKDYGRDYSYSEPLESYERHMNTCMNAMEHEPEENQQIINDSSLQTMPTGSSLAPNNNTDNNTAADSSSNSTTPNHPSQPEAKDLAPTSQIPSEATPTPDNDSDTVSIMEIGYPALIKLMRVRKCLEKYMVYSEKYLKLTGAAPSLETGCEMVLAAVASTLLMLMNSNMLH